MKLALLMLLVGLGVGVDGAWGGDAVVNSLGMKFVTVPGTKVLMCIHETRKSDYAAYAKANPKIDMTWKRIEAYGVPVSEGDDHPVVNVNWEDAVAFCEWLSQKEGRVYRLPTDREWSYAAGIATKEERGLTPEKLDAKLKEIYPWGKTWPPPAGVANLADTAGASRIPGMVVVPGYTDGFVTTAPVMSFRPNKLGFYDLSGNVWEWCEDWYNQERKERVLRGGSWCYDPLSLLASDRLHHAPTTRDMYRGFRCVLVGR